MRSIVVLAGLLRIFGREIPEQPIVATIQVAGRASCFGSKRLPLTNQFSPSSMKPASTRHEQIPNIHHFPISSHFPSIGLSATIQNIAATIKNQSSMTSHFAMNSSSGSTATLTS
ncbi:hypothetical protein ACET3Z_027966 [Daucus carota]